VSNYHELVPLPHPGDINTGLSACRQSTMMALFGRPGRLTRDCSPVTSPKLMPQLVTRGVGPFQVSGWIPAVDSLQRVLIAVKVEKPDLWAVVHSAGMLCCRAVRGSQNSYSNHSWGTAIDLTIESQIDELGSLKCQRGILELYPFFHKEGWFSGMGYSGRKDPMHFEGSDETVRRWFKEYYAK
jgi:hypothetical protein